MKALVIYDSNFGNTQIIAKTIGKEIGEDAKVISIDEFQDADLHGVDLLIVGSPINGWRPTDKISQFLSRLEPSDLKGKSAAAFDTRIKVFFSGDAAKRISLALAKAGAKIIAPPQAFLVKDQEGPLVEGEVEKATHWAKVILARIKTS